MAPTSEEFEFFLAYSQKNMIFDDLKADFFRGDADVLGTIPMDNREPEHVRPGKSGRRIDFRSLRRSGIPS